MRGVRSELLRLEPLALLLSEDHPLAELDAIPVASFEKETLLLFPRDLAPGYYDRVIAACEQCGFQPDVKTFADPPPPAMVARVRATREVGLPPTSFAFHVAAGELGVVARKLVQPVIMVEWSVLWSERAQSAAIGWFLESSRRCSEEHDWLRRLRRDVRGRSERAESRGSVVRRTFTPSSTPLGCKGDRLEPEPMKHL